MSRDKGKLPSSRPKLVPCVLVINLEIASENVIMDSVEYDEIAVNFERVLNGLLQQNYNVTSDVYFDMFIKHLSSKDASGVGTADFRFVC